MGQDSPVAIITGAASGIGKALADRYRAAGYAVGALDLSFQDDVSGADTIYLQCDVTDSESARKAVERVQGKWGRIDVLVNNAGISHFSEFASTDLSVVRKVMDVNFFGAVNCTKPALEHLVKARGQIIAISSIAGFSPLYERTAYSASKHALHGFFDSLRSEVEDSGVRVMVCCPSFVATRIHQSATKQGTSSSRPSRATAGKELRPEEMADLIFRDAARSKALSLPTFMARTAWWVSHLFPSFYLAKMKKMMKLS